MICEEGWVVVAILDLVLHTDGRPDHVDSGGTVSQRMIPGVLTYPWIKRVPHQKGLRGRKQGLTGRHTFDRSVWSQPLKGSWMVMIEVWVQNRIKVPTYKCGATHVHKIRKQTEEFVSCQITVRGIEGNKAKNLLPYAYLHLDEMTSIIPPDFVKAVS